MSHAKDDVIKATMAQNDELARIIQQILAVSKTTTAGPVVLLSQPAAPLVAPIPIVAKPAEATVGPKPVEAGPAVPAHQATQAPVPTTPERKKEAVLQEEETKEKEKEEEEKKAAVQELARASPTAAPKTTAKPTPVQAAPVARKPKVVHLTPERAKVKVMKDTASSPLAPARIVAQEVAVQTTPSVLSRRAAAFFAETQELETGKDVVEEKEEEEAGLTTEAQQDSLDIEEGWERFTFE